MQGTPPEGRMINSCSCKQCVQSRSLSAPSNICSLFSFPKIVQTDLSTSCWSLRERQNLKGNLLHVVCRAGTETPLLNFPWVPEVTWHDPWSHRALSTLDANREPTSLRFHSSPFGYYAWLSLNTRWRSGVMFTLARPIARFHVYSYSNLPASGETAVCRAACVDSELPGRSSRQDFMLWEGAARPCWISLSVLGHGYRFELFTAQADSIRQPLFCFVFF